MGLFKDYISCCIRKNLVGVKIKVDFSYKIKKGVQKKNENKIIKSNNNNINNNNDNIYDQNSKSNPRMEEVGKICQKNIFSNAIKRTMLVLMIFMVA